MILAHHFPEIRGPQAISQWTRRAVRKTGSFEQRVHRLTTTFSMRLLRLIVIRHSSGFTFTMAERSATL